MSFALGNYEIVTPGVGNLQGVKFMQKVSLYKFALPHSLPRYTLGKIKVPIGKMIHSWFNENVSDLTMCEKVVIAPPPTLDKTI